MFVDALRGFATEVADPRVGAVAERMAAPVRVAVCGRRGVGRRTVARALESRGVAVWPHQVADLVVYVVAEVAKPEDTAAVAASSQPVVVVHNKTDLTGRSVLAGVAARLAAPVLPVAGLLAVAALDGGAFAALQVLAAEPADLTSAERFLAGPHRLPREVRLALCEALDLPGIGHAVAAIRHGASADPVRELLHGLSGIDAVVHRLDTVGAAVRYRRLLDAVEQLEALAVGDERIGDFLASDDTVLARMAAAVDVVQAVRLVVDADGDAGALLRRAARWQRYRCGPVTGLHAACGSDIARGTLRLWAAAGSWA